MIKKSGTTFNLADSTVFILHPNDEMPQKRGNEKFLSQYQHGNINVKSGLSVGFLFRCVKTTVEVHVSNDRLVAPRTVTNSKSIAECKNTMLQFKTIWPELEMIFKEEVRVKLHELKWI